MIITCEKCDARFNLDETLLKPEGSKVRCTKCKHVFLAVPDVAAAGDDLLSEAAEASPVEPAPDVAEDSAADMLSDDFGLDIEGAGEETAEISGTDSGKVEDVDLDDLDLDLDFDFEDGEKAEEIPDESETFELDIETDSGEKVGMEIEDVDLIGDVGLDVEETSGDEISGDSGMELVPDEDRPAEKAEDTDSGIEFELDFEEDDALGAAGAEPEKSEDIEFDLGDFDEDVEAPTLEDEAELELSLDDIEMEDKAEPEPEDLSLEFDLEMEAEEKDGSDDESLSDDFELDFDIGDEELTAGDELEELELDLDVEEPLPEEAAGEEELELDLDLDDMGGEVEETREVTDDLELDLDLDLAEEVSAADELTDLDEDFELELDLEETAEEEMGSAELDEEFELDLDLEGESAEDIPEAGPEEDFELELDLEAPGIAAEDEVSDDSGDDFDLALDLDEAPEEESPAADAELDDFELDFESEEEESARPVEALSEPEGADEEAAAVYEPAEPEEEVRDKKAPAEIKEKKSGKALVWIFVLVVLFGGAFALFQYKDSIPFMDKIPFPGKQEAPAVQDPGNLKLAALNINGKFIENQNAGQLFVISGQVKNGYDTVRSFISLSGKLYSGEGRIAKKTSVSAGNTLSDIELQSMDLAEINKRLKNRMGDNGINTNIAPGKNVPFMIVFANLPENLSEFTVEPLSSEGN